MLPPLVIDPLAPRSTTGRFAAKASVGDPFPIEARIVKDGHDILAAHARIEWSGGADVIPLKLIGDDLWRGDFTPMVYGAHTVTVVAWTDRYGTWCRDIVKRATAQQDLEVEFEVGALLLDQLHDAAMSVGDVHGAAALAGAAHAVRRIECSDATRLNAALDDALSVTVAAVSAAAVVPSWDVSSAAPLAVWVERELAAAGAWYELFPRSFGGLRAVIDELARVRRLGFDVLYLPPIHPIGITHRKGPNNTLVAGPNDVGSPWAIGGMDGGHTAIHADLGDEDDFAALIEAAASHGIEIALDLAFQCSPDHPWVADHPEWFERRPDGSIRYAENPPKKYQDIYPINFWPEREADREALWQACLEVVLHWMRRGVLVFRVDNPHTKPVAMWEWLIDRARAENEAVVFLAEAFTAPAMMAKLGEIGFSSGYTYFTWRETRQELTDYVGELASEPLISTMRPNFWPNTPDILEGVLRNGPLSAFALRFVLAATLVPNYGIYAGFELGENTPASPDNTEYSNSEKYQLVTRDFTVKPNLEALITSVNDARRAHRALRRLRTTTFHPSDNDSLLVWSRCAPRVPARHAGADLGVDRVLVVVNLDPFEPQEGTLELDLEALGLSSVASLRANDHLSGESWLWHGPNPWVRLDPSRFPAHVISLEPFEPVAAFESG